jgi:hypothetical protein
MSLPANTMMALKPHTCCYNVPRAQARKAAPPTMRRLVPAMDHRQVKAEARPRFRVQRANSSANDRVVADLVVYGGDFPWVNARLDPEKEA